MASDCVIQVDPREALASVMASIQPVIAEGLANGYHSEKIAKMVIEKLCTLPPPTEGREENEA